MLSYGRWKNWPFRLSPTSDLSYDTLCHMFSQGPDPLSDSVARSDQLLRDLGGADHWNCVSYYEFLPGRVTESDFGSRPLRRTRELVSETKSHLWLQLRHAMSHTQLRMGEELVSKTKSHLWLQSRYAMSHTQLRMGEELGSKTKSHLWLQLRHAMSHAQLRMGEELGSKTEFHLWLQLLS